LTDGHRCPRRRSIVAVELIASALAGGFALWLLQAAFDPLGQIADMDVLSFAAGMVAGVAINRFVRS
jgi:hypothetical protein